MTVKDLLPCSLISKTCICVACGSVEHTVEECDSEASEEVRLSHMMTHF